MRDVDQIKQITIEIHDIKERKRNKINSSMVQNTVNVRNHISNGPLQEDHGKHDESGIRYKDNTQTVHPVPDSESTQEHCALTQYPVPTGPTASPPLPPELHFSSPSSGNPVKPVSSTTPWSKRPNDPVSPGNEGDNIGGVVDLPCTTNRMTSGDVNDVGPCNECRKAGV